MKTLITLTESLGHGVYAFSNGNILTVGMDYQNELCIGTLYKSGSSTAPIACHKFKSYSEVFNLFGLEKTELSLTEFAD